MYNFTFEVDVFVGCDAEFDVDLFGFFVAIVTLVFDEDVVVSVFEISSCDVETDLASIGGFGECVCDGCEVHADMEYGLSEGVSIEVGVEWSNSNERAIGDFGGNVSIVLDAIEAYFILTELECATCGGGLKDFKECFEVFTA